MAETDCFFADNHCCISFWQNVAIVDICHDMDVPRMKKVGQAYASLLERYPSGIAALIMLRPGTPIASHEARAEIARSSRELGERLLRVSMVVEDRGVLAQMLRTVVRGISVVVRQTRIQMFEDVDSAITATVPVVIPLSAERNVHGELSLALARMRMSFHPSMKPARSARR